MILTALLSACLSFADAPLPALSALPLKSEVTDTLRVGDEPNADARLCLAGLSWTPSRFEVSCSKATNSKIDVLVRFASPLPSGDARNDVVVVEGSLVKDKTGQPIKARAVVVVHESGSGMTVGKLFASGLRDRGFMPSWCRCRTTENDAASDDDRMARSSVRSCGRQSRTCVARATRSPNFRGSMPRTSACRERASAGS